MKLKPMADNILLKQQECAETTVSGIILATTNKEKPQIAEVLAVGPGKPSDNGGYTAMTVKVGDKVIASKYAGTAVKIDGAEYTILPEDDIYATVD